MVSPHFPPDTTAGTHRVRLLAPHLPAYGWEPVVVTVDPDRYEGRVDPELLALVPPGVRVARSTAWSARWTRVLGIGDLGLRAFTGLYRTSAALLARERFDALFITIYPTYPALIGPRLKRRFGVPFVLDYQDPWVGAWGDTVGGGPRNRVDFKSRLTRRLASWLEPRVISAADGVTAVSTRTYTDVLKRIRNAPDLVCATIPIGGDPADFEAVRRRAAPNRWFNRDDGLLHFCYVGTLLPHGVTTLRGLLKAATFARAAHPRAFERLRLHFLGTSNQTGGSPEPSVLPHARELGLEAHVTEQPTRLLYLDALQVQLDAHVLLLMGSSEAHYTASKLYPALLARRPIVALYHRDSSVVDLLRHRSKAPSVELVTYDGDATEDDIAASAAPAFARALAPPVYNEADIDMAALTEFSAEHLAGRLAGVLDQVAVRARR
jgi:glycosyltransferase involved in cell wall biosynthesis